MAIILGREGYLYMGKSSGGTAVAGIANVDNWSLTLNADPIETTAFASGGITVRTFEGGLKSGSGSLSGSYDAGTHHTYITQMLAQSAMTSVLAVLYLNASDYFSATLCITSVEVGSTIDGKTTFSMSYNTTGTVTKT